MDVFDFTHHLYHRLAVAHDFRAPIYAEIHPGLHCDTCSGANLTALRSFVREFSDLRPLGTRDL